MMTRKSPEPNPWWSTWPGALGLGVTSLLLVSAPAVIFALYATMLTDAVLDVDGLMLDLRPPLVLRILALLWVAVIVTLPVLTLRWARKKWLGWLLVGIGGSAFALITAFFALGIL